MYASCVDPHASCAHRRVQTHSLSHIRYSGAFKHRGHDVFKDESNLVSSRLVSSRKFITTESVSFTDCNQCNPICLSRHSAKETPTDVVADVYIHA